MRRLLILLAALGVAACIGRYLAGAFDDLLVAAIMTLIVLISFTPFLAHHPGDRVAR